jgi:hypothetical protein
MNIRVERKLPGTVTIIAEEDTALYYTELGGKYYLLSGEMRVLESSQSQALIAEDEKLLHIILPGVARAVVGEKVQYFRPRNEEYVLATLESIMGLDEVGSIDVVDMSDRFELKIRYDNRINVELGDAEDIPSKVRFAFAMIDEFSEFATGTVSARSVESGYVSIVDPQATPKA